MKVVISKRATRSAERIATRWARDADHPDVFAREFVAMIELLASTSSPGAPAPTTMRMGLRRLLLEKSRCHVYFEMHHRTQTIQILQVWDARRGRLPVL